MTSRVRIHSVFPSAIAPYRQFYLELPEYLHRYSGKTHKFAFFVIHGRFHELHGLFLKLGGLFLVLCGPSISAVVSSIFHGVLHKLRDAIRNLRQAISRTCKLSHLALPPNETRVPSPEVPS